jgi:hypothetical protein
MAFLVQNSKVSIHAIWCLPNGISDLIRSSLGSTGLPHGGELRRSESIKAVTFAGPRLAGTET